MVERGVSNITTKTHKEIPYFSGVAYSMIQTCGYTSLLKRVDVCF